MSEQERKRPSEHEQLLKRLDALIWLNAVIASELIQITETNVRVINGKHGTIPEHCISEHKELRRCALKMAKEFCPTESEILNKHLKWHFNDDCD